MIMLAIYYSLLAVNICACFLLLRSDLKEYCPAAVLWFVIASSFLLPGIGDPFVGRVAAHPLSIVYDLDIGTLLESQIFIAVILFIFNLVYCLRRVLVGRRFSTSKIYYEKQLFESKSSGLFFYLLFLLIALYGFYEAYEKYGVGMFSSFTFTERREGLSAISGFLLSYNLLVCAGVVFWLVFNKRFLLSVLFVGVYLFIYFVMGGSRQPIIVLLLPFVFYFVFFRRHGFLYAVLLSASFGLVSKLLEFVIYIRNTSGLNARLERLSELPSFLFSFGEKLGSKEEDLRFVFYYYVKNFDGLAGFGDFTYFSRIMFFWLPSSLDWFGWKPEDFEYVMFSHFIPEFVGTMHPTFFGTIYADSGWLILPWLLFFVIMLLLTGPVLRCYRGIPYFSVWGLFAYAYMMIARGAFYGPFVVLVFGLLFAAVVQLFSRSLKFKVNFGEANSSRYG